MEKKSGISKLQIIFLAAGSALIVAYTIAPVVGDNVPGNELLLTFIMSFLYLIILNLPVFILSQLSKGKNFVTFLTGVTGKVPGKIIACIFAFFCMTLMLFSLRSTAHLTSMYLLPDTPEFLLVMLTLLPVVYIAFKGAGTLGRVGTFIVPLMLLTVMVYFFFGFAEFKGDDFLSLFGVSGFGELNKNAFLTAARSSDSLIILFFACHLTKNKKQNKTGRIFIIALSVVIVFSLMIVVPVLMVLGPALSKMYVNPYFVYCRQVGLFGVIQKIQSFNIFFWYLGTILRLSVFMYICCFILGSIQTKFKHTKFVVPVSLLLLGICMIPAFDFSLIGILSQKYIFSLWISSVVFALPLLILAVCAVKKIVAGVKRRKRLPLPG